MKLPIYTATAPPARGSGLAWAQDIGSLTASSNQALYSGLGAFGRGLNVAADTAFRATLQRQAIDDDIEFGSATQRVLSDVRQAADAASRLDVSIDMPLPDDPKYSETLTAFSTEKRDNLISEALKDIEKNKGKYTKGFHRPENQAKFEQWFEDRYGAFEYQLKSMYGRKLDDYQRGELSRLSEDAAKNGDVETANKYVGLMDAHELVTHEKAEALKKDNEIIAQTNTLYDESKLILDVEGYESARDFIMSQKIDTDIKKNVLSDINFEASQLKIAAEKRQEQKNVEYLLALRQNKLTEKQISSDLSAGIIDSDLAKEYFRYIDSQAEEIIKGQKIQTNQIIKGDLETMAYGIHDGSVTMPKFLKRLKEERYDKQSIDDSAYDSLLTIAQGKYETYQAKEMASRIAHAKTQLVTYGDELGFMAKLQKATSTEAEQLTSDRQLQLDNLDQYRRSLYDWFETQREQKKYPMVDEIYAEGRRILSHYRKPIEQLREEYANRQVDDQARDKLRTAIREHGQEELKKAKELMSDKYKEQLDILRLQFNLNNEELDSAKKYLNEGATLDDLVKYLQGK